MKVLNIVFLSLLFQGADEFMARQEYLFTKIDADKIIFRAPNMKPGDSQEDALIRMPHFFYIFGFDLRTEGYAVLEKEGGGIKRTLYTDERAPILVTKVQGFDMRGLDEFRDNEKELMEGAIYWEFTHRGRTRQTSMDGESGKLDRLITAMRTIKSPAELELIQIATDITCNAHKEVMKRIKALEQENDIEKILHNEYLKGGAQEIGFKCIVGSGMNGVTLHYQENDDELPEDTLVVIDIGCKYNTYVTDVTRTVPTSGKFTGRMREAYEAVLGAQKAAEKLLRPGVTIAQLQQESVSYLNSKGFPRYPHGLGHHVGLSVHDANSTGYTKPLRAGMVITIEPGYYSREDGFGIRIEDMYLVTEEGFIRMSASAPREIDEIEALANAEGAVVTGEKKFVFNIKDSDIEAPQQTRRRMFGIRMDRSLTKEDIKRLGLDEGSSAIKISSVVPDSVADKAGIKSGDYIISFGGTGLTEADPYGTLVGAIQKAKKGMKIEVVVLRDSEKVALEAVFGN